MRRTLHPLACTAALTVAVTFAGAPVSAATAKSTPKTSSTSSATADFDWSEAIAAGKTLEVKGINGSIEAVPARGREARVRAIKRAHRRGDPDAVTIELVRHEGGVTVCAVYPSKRGDEPNSCAPGSRGHMNTDDNDTEVQFMIEVPAGVQCVPRTVNGDVSAQGLTGTVDAQTVNGSIDVETSGMVSAQTVNGSIRVEMGRLADDVEFSTVNGGITVAITGDVDATLRAATMNGSIESDFPVTIQGKAGRRSLQGTLGKGGPRIDLESVNGSLRLRRAGSSGTTSQ